MLPRLIYYLFIRVARGRSEKVKNNLTNDHNLDVDDSRQLLDPVEQDVTLLYDGLVLRVLRVWSVRHNNSANLVNLAMETPISYQPA